MKFNQTSAEIFIPDGHPTDQALTRTTHLAISAHQDDLEIMAAAPIIECYQREDRWFTGVVLTDGRGSPRANLYYAYDDEAMHAVRIKEQKKAAVIGEYAAQILLDYPSQMVKDSAYLQPIEDITSVLLATQPQYVYTHNMADKHDTHVAVALRTLAAIRGLPAADRPLKLYGCEAWRSLDWLVDNDKILLDLSEHENLQAALLGVFDSQISGGKRYDLASLGRRRANATYLDPHSVDDSNGLLYAMDLTPLIEDPALDVATFVDSVIQRFAGDVRDRLSKYI